MERRPTSLRIRLLLLVGLALIPALALILYTAWEQDHRPVSDLQAGMLGVALVAMLALAVAWLGGDVLVLREVRSRRSITRPPAVGATAGRGGWPQKSGDLRPLPQGPGGVGQASPARPGAAERLEAERRAVDVRAAWVLGVDTDAIIGVNHLQRVILFNKGAERIFGYPVAEAMGQPLDLLLPSDLPEARRPHLRDLAASPKRREVVGRRKDGQLFPAEVGVSMGSHSMGSQMGHTTFMLVLRDVTEGKQAEEALRESEARFRGAFEHSAAGMALQGIDGSFVRVNRALCEMLGYSEQELLATTHQALVHPDDPEPEVWYERDLLAGSIRWYKREQRYRHQDGRLVWGLVSVSMVRAHDGRPLHFLVQVHDVTERKRAEELEGQLRQAQKIEAVGQLAAGVAHDFNNLLSVITGRSHILLHRLPADDPLRRHVELIKETARRAGALTQQLLAFSRKQVLEPQVLDLNVIVTEMAPMLRRLIGEHIDLVTVPGPALGRVKTDPSQLEQIILNLVVNARDAMPQGGRLALETRDVELDDAFVRERPGARPGPHVALAVRDTGMGMDAATRSRVFEPFFTTKGAGKGTGLGLATVYGIVKQSGGYIDVESEPGTGTTFTVYLPRVDEEVDSREPVQPLSEIPRGTETILLVEDEEAVRDLAREILQQDGYTVLGARHGGEALLLGDRHPGRIHVVVTDVVMPEMGGRELGERLAATRPEIKVVYMSGYTDEALEHHGVLEPGTAFIRKPLTPDTLIRKVREVLDDPLAGRPLVRSEGS